MKKLGTVLFFACGVLSLSCGAQSIPSEAWKTFEFTGPNLKAEFPCEPKLTEKLYQEKPKIARSFGITCSNETFDFSISLPERFGEYKIENVDTELDEFEITLKIMIDDKALITSRHIVFGTFPAREFIIKNDWSIGRQIVFAHERGLYSIQVLRPDRNVTLSQNQVAEFETVANKFIDSFQLLK